MRVCAGCRADQCWTLSAGPAPQSVVVAQVHDDDTFLTWFRRVCGILAGGDHASALEREIEEALAKGGAERRAWIDQGGSDKRVGGDGVCVPR